LLARDRIYLSDFFHAKLDAAARNNLRRAITTKR
jgi:predicted metal-dependent HD superfamily phosphohydrolase